MSGDDGLSEAIEELFGTPKRWELLDYFLTYPVDPDGENKSEIAEGARMHRNSVGRHIDVLVDVGLVEEKGDGQIKRYAPRRDTEVYQRLVELNNVLYREHEGVDR